MTIERRQQVYSTVFQFMIENDIAGVIPFDIESLCKRIGVNLIPLSKIKGDLKLTDDELFAIWGNEDGAIYRCNDTHCITYNDFVTYGRIRFTLCEELGHMIMGHTKDNNFNIFNQKYSTDIYKSYEEEGRTCAGLLLCNPKFFYTYQSILTPRTLGRICGLTSQCAKTRYEVLARFKDEIITNSVYPFLPVPKYPVDDLLIRGVAI